MSDQIKPRSRSEIDGQVQLSDDLAITDSSYAASSILLQGRAAQVLSQNPESSPYDSQQLDHARAVTAMTNFVVSDEFSGTLPDVFVVPSWNGLPASVKDPHGDRLTTAEYKRRGSFSDGTNIWIVADSFEPNHSGFGALQRAMAREIVGHFGVKQIVEAELGDDGWSRIRADLLALEQNGSGSKALQVIMADARRVTQFRDDDTFAQEAIASMAALHDNPSPFKRAIAATRSFVRRFVPSLSLSEGELRQFVAASNDLVRSNGFPARNTIVMFDHAKHDSADRNGAINGADNAGDHLDRAVRVNEYTFNAMREMRAGDRSGLAFVNALLAGKAGYDVPMPEALRNYPHLAEAYQLGSDEFRAQAGVRITSREGHDVNVIESPSAVLEHEFDRLRNNVEHIAESLALVKASGMPLDQRDKQELHDAQYELDSFVHKHSEVFARKTEQGVPAPENGLNDRRATPMMRPA